MSVMGSDRFAEIAHYLVLATKENKIVWEDISNDEKICVLKDLGSNKQNIKQYIYISIYEDYLDHLHFRIRMGPLSSKSEILEEYKSETEISCLLSDVKHLEYQYNYLDIKSSFPDIDVVTLLKDIV